MLKDRIILVTGASDGIGREAALTYARYSASVILLGRNDEKLRAVGHGKKVGVIQFIKGTWPNGERNLLEPHGVEFQVMATGFTWNTQDRDSDTAACLAVWEHARRMLADDQLDLVLLDELTYMVAYDYLPLESVLSALRERPAHQSVIITGRGCHRDIIELADTVSELRPVKHAFDAGIKAQMGIDY